MRVYFEKPRTTVGWKGLINDPDMDDSGKVNDGLRRARELLLEVLSVGLPVACEFLDPITPQYISDLVSWGAIGARTTESQIHRQLASGLSMPIGFKNGTSGDVAIAVDAVRAAAAAHAFAGIDDDGEAATMYTTGNEDCHVILRGGRNAPNYNAEAVTAVLSRLEAAGLPRRVSSTPRTTTAARTTSASRSSSPTSPPRSRAPIARSSASCSSRSSSAVARSSSPASHSSTASRSPTRAWTGRRRSTCSTGSRRQCERAGPERRHKKHR